MLVREEIFTGAIAASSVNSSTFSMADLEGLMGGGLTRVACSAMAFKVKGRDGVAVRYSIDLIYSRLVE